MTDKQLENLARELRTSEERFQNLIINSPDGVVVVDSAGMVHFVNPAAESLFGRERDELVGQLFGFPVVADQTTEVDILRYGGKPTVAEMRVVETEWLGEPVLLATLRDVTDRIRLMNELQRSNQELERFAYVVSHDLKAPLRTVTGFCEILHKDCEGRLGEQADEHLQYILQGADRMRSIIDDLLEYSRVRKAEKPNEPVDFAQIIDLAVSNLQSDIRKSGAVVTCDNLPTLIANQSQMLQLVQNLIGNAIKFHGPQPPVVHVAAEQQQDGWLFSVRDNGIGIDRKQLERVFEVFRRLHSPTKYGGTGIGLSICKKIVELHAGRIWIESEPGQGSIFYFTIPAPESSQSNA